MLIQYVNLNPMVPSEIHQYKSGMLELWRCFDVFVKISPRSDLGPSINGLVTDGNTKLCCRGFVLELFQSTTAGKIDSKHTRNYTNLNFIIFLCRWFLAKSAENS